MELTQIYLTFIILGSVYFGIYKPSFDYKLILLIIFIGLLSFVMQLLPLFLMGIFSVIFSPLIDAIAKRFPTKEAKLLYRELVKINGVGPKLALAVLSAYTPDQFVMAIKKENLAQIVKIPGVGKKTAERLLIELKDRLANFNVVSSETVDTLTAENDDNARVVIDVDIENQAVIALVGLGFKQQQAETMVRKNYKDGMKVEDIIRESLKNN